MQFNLEELGHPAPPQAQKEYLASWGFTPSYHPAMHHGAPQHGRVGSASAPNILMARPKKQQARASTPLLPIPPPGAPQQITRTANGKKRIQPTFLGLGGIIPRQGLMTTSAPQQEQQTPSLQPAFGHTAASYGQPGPSAISSHDVEMMDARMQGTPRTAQVLSRVS